MFNAWDAHRMGNCQDRPIDLYLNDTSGLIVRDYGPGIAPEEIGPIYCIYGNSTKRKDDNQTGGFGLGSKSPFSYTDSFTVTNHHNGKKFLYVVNRSVEENNGGPGMTPVINGIDTEESGLIVTVPLKSDNDRHRAYYYIKDILYLSGIKVNIHYAENKKIEGVETIESESVAPNEFVNQEDKSGLWAVYGGVRYEIKSEDRYQEEYKFLLKLSRILGAFHIGFAPNTLTPLPSREGLNLSEQTVENIKSQLETLHELFMEACVPACRTAMERTIKMLAETGIQSQFTAYRWMNLGDNISMFKIANERPILEGPEKRRPAHVRDAIWNSMVIMAFKNTGSMKHLIGGHVFERMKRVVFVKQYPEWKKYLNYLTDSHCQSSRFDTTLEAEDFSKYVIEMNQAKTAIHKATGQDVDIRMNFGKYNWTIVSGHRGGKKTPTNISRHREEAIKKQKALGIHKEPEKVSLDRLWSHATGKEVCTTMLHKHIIIAKTATALNETKFKFQKYFAPNGGEVNSLYHPMHISRFRWSNKPYIVAAMVVHEKKGGYDKSKEVLENLGFIIIEANEPEVKKTQHQQFVDMGLESPKSVTKRGPPTFPIVAPHIYRTWTVEGAPEITNPQAYFCATIKEINGYYTTPSRSLLTNCLKKWPRVVILHNKRRESILKKKNVPHLAEKINDEVIKLLANEDRIKQMYIHVYLHKNSNLPKEIISIPEIQKMMGIPYLLTKQKKAFQRDLDFLNEVKNERSDGVYSSTREMIKAAFSKYDMDPSLSMVRKMCEKSLLLNNYQLKRAVKDMKPGKLKCFAQVISQFLRTV